MKEGIVLDISEKKKFRFSKGFKIVALILGVLMLFPIGFIILLAIPSYEHTPEPYNLYGGQEISDQEVIGGYLDEIRDYTDNIYANLTLVDTTYYLMDTLNTESIKYAQILHDSMSRCLFSPYPYSKSRIISEELLEKVNMLEESTNIFCNMVEEGSSLALDYYNSNNIEEKVDIYIQMYDINNQAYDLGIVIYDICDEVYKMVGE